jgi:ribonuclease T1
MKRLPVAVLVLLLAAIAFWPAPEPRTPATSSPPESASATTRTPEAAASPGARAAPFLPAEAHDTLARIARGGPFPHRQDGSVFQNRERRLPARPSGYYREYTVRTPGERTRGARRIVTGGDPPTQFWYTDDHYASFRRFEVSP